MPDNEAARARAAVAAKLFGDPQPAAADPPDKSVEASSSPGQPTQVGRYRIDGSLGAGGMGVVYRAHDPELDRMVAVKLLREATVDGSDPDGEARALARRRLLREARAMARLAHPNVIHVYDVGSFGDQVFVAMELVDGVDLARWLRERERSFDEVLDCYLLAGEGLCAAHDAGLVHRDFKPENVLVGRDGRVRVLDFGLARSAEAAPQTREEPVAATGPAVDTGAATVSSGELDKYDADTPIAPNGPPVAEIGSAPTVASGPQQLHTGKKHVDTPRSAADQPIDGDALTVASEPPRVPSQVPSQAYRPALTSFTRTGAVMGTPRYMSPEQVLGRAADARSDQFSFCVAIYEAAYGQTAFPSQGLHAYLDDIVEGNLRPPPADTTAPSWLWPILERGLATAPGARFATMRELLQQLVAARQSPHEVDASTSTRRGRAGLFAAIFVALAGVIVWQSTAGERPASAPQASQESVQGAVEPSAGPAAPSGSPAHEQVSQQVEATTDAGSTSATTGHDESTTETGESTTETGESTTGAAQPPATPKRPQKRDFCAMHEDTYALLSRTSRRKSTVKDRNGQCYKCRSETRASRIRRFRPDDCARYQVCHRVGPEECS